MYKINIEKSSENNNDFIDMADLFSYDAYLQFMEDNSVCLIDGASSY